MSELLQFLFAGATLGFTYALAALGFSIVYNASGAINFAQGDFLMLGGMGTVAFQQAGLPLPLAVLAATLCACLVSAVMVQLVVARMAEGNVASLILATIGASLFIEGAVQVILGKGQHTLAPFSGDTPLAIGQARLLPQSLWVAGVALVAVAALAAFFTRTRLGKAVLATSYNRLAARLVGINTHAVLLIAFGLAAALGSVAGIVTTPITMTAYDAGVMLGLKGFVAAVIGGLGSFPGAVAGGLLLGVLEALGAGYVSSAYKDAIPFLLIFLILFFMPRGLFGLGTAERV
jgi:branched-chain amino acid transport system permease protein